MYSTVQGEGERLLLVHGLGSSSHTWSGLLPALTQDRQVITVDLPGHGRTPADHDSASFAGLSRSLEEFLRNQDLVDVAMVGSSLGGRLVLEMARRELAGPVVALDPGGFWLGWERTYLKMTLLASVLMLRGFDGMRAALAHGAVSRSILLAQLSARPWALDGDLVQAELDSYAATATFVELVNDLAAAPMQHGPVAPPSRRIAICWGRHDRLCWPNQAYRALAAFPSGTLHWFEHSGHFPHWDEPEEIVKLIREATAA